MDRYTLDSGNVTKSECLRVRRILCMYNVGKEIIFEVLSLPPSCMHTYMHTYMQIIKYIYI